MTEEADRTLAEKYLKLQPHLQSQYDIIYAELKAKNYPEGASGSFLDQVARQLLSSHEPNQMTAELRSFVAFVNNEYGAKASDDAELEIAIVHHLPDPQVDTEIAALLTPKVRAEVDKEWDWRSQPDEREFVNRLCEGFPELRSLSNGITHGRENDILPSPFMVTVTAYLVKNVVTGTADKIEETKQILGYLGRQHGDDESVDFLIESSCLGMFPRTYEPGYNIVELLGPELEAAYRKHWNIPADKPLTSN